MSNISFARTEQRHPFHLVDPSPWPLTTAFSMLAMALGGVMYMHLYPSGGLVGIIGFAMVLLTMFL